MEQLENSSPKNLRLRACAYLRCKKDFYAAPSEEAEGESLTPQDYWCGRTLSSFGPDEEIADLRSCQPGRQCHSTTVSVQDFPPHPS
ncbi:MAG: hypothetical protein QXI19_11970 [Candidatus Caldarchaeum sp.]